MLYKVRQENKVREIRIYHLVIINWPDLLELSPEASQHVGVVLRMQAGEQLTLFCGDNREFKAIIETVKKKQVVVIVGSIKEK